MKRISWRRGVWALALAACLGPVSGCSILGLAYFVGLMVGMETREKPKFGFPEEQSLRIVVVTRTDFGSQIELGAVDRELNEMVARKLFEGFDGEKKLKQVKVIKATKVAKWQDEHPNWHGLEPVEVGRAFQADYVIYLEVLGLNLYEDGATRNLYHGRTDVAITVVKVDDSDGEQLHQEELHFEYPINRPIPSADLSLARFRREFLGRLADQVSWYFVPHEQVYNPGADRF